MKDPPDDRKQKEAVRVIRFPSPCVGLGTHSPLGCVDSPRIERHSRRDADLCPRRSLRFSLRISRDHPVPWSFPLLPSGVAGRGDEKTQDPCSTLDSILCAVERLDDRRLLSSGSMVSPLLLNPVGYQAVRPNTPVMPFSTPSKKATFIDPTVQIENGNSVVLGYQNFIGPYVKLDGQGGAIKIANGSDVLDSASIVANPSHQHGQPVVLIGDQVVIGFGAKVLGPSTIGAVDAAAKPTSIGANAEIDGATIEPGAIVSPLARVGPGVTVPSGYRVLPGANVTTNAEASNPKLGMVVPVTASDTSTVKQTLSENESLTVGYSQLYQGNSATGVSTGFTPAVTGVNDGNLSNVLGASQEPGPSSASFEPSASAPHFLRPNGGLIGVLLNTFPARLTGNVEI